MNASTRERAPCAPTTHLHEVVHAEDPGADLRTRRSWHVVFANDPVTPAEYVIRVLHEEYAYPTEEAVRLTWEAHTTGRVVAKVCGREEAQAKAAATRRRVHDDGHLLQVFAEEAGA